MGRPVGLRRGFVLTLVFLLAISTVYGLERMYRFEVAAISIDWLALVTNGVLLSFLLEGARR